MTHGYFAYQNTFSGVELQIHYSTIRVIKIQKVNALPWYGISVAVFNWFKFHSVKQLNSSENILHLLLEGNEYIFT